MILHNGLGAPWQLAEGTFAIFSFWKVEGRKPLPASPGSHRGAFMTWYFTSGSLEWAESCLPTFTAVLGARAFLCQTCPKECFFKAANIKQIRNVLFSHSQCFQMMLSCCAHQRGGNEEAFSKGRLCFWISINLAALFAPLFSQRCFQIPMFLGLCLILVNSAKIPEQC